MESVRRIVLVTVIGLILSGAVALAQPKLSAGRVTSHNGLTLYTFDNDSAGSGKSVCNAPCSNIFAPYLVEPGARAPAAFSIITRDDGQRQWAYKGKPLYRWYDDKRPGEAGGDGMNRGIWHRARP